MTRWQKWSLLAVNTGALAAVLTHLNGNSTGMYLGPLIPVAILANSLGAAWRRDRAAVLYLTVSVLCLAGSGLTVYWIAGAHFSPYLNQANPIWIALNRVFVIAVFAFGGVLPFLRQGRLLRDLRVNLFLPFHFCWLVLVIILLSPELIPGFEMYVSSFALFYAGVFLGSFCLHSCFVQDRPKRLALLMLAVFAFGLFHLPLLGSWLTIHYSQKEYPVMFTPEPRRVTLSIPAYYLGFPAKACSMTVHRSFVEGTDLRLNYDGFFPIGQPPPMGFPVIVRLHGGGWMGGDKGDANRIQLSKHLASLGYAVFDIQYGLNNRLRLGPFVRGPSYLMGDYSIDDMVNHVGQFLDYLSIHKEHLGIDPSRTVLFGNSAGGQLALAASLALAEEKYPHLISADVTIRGVIACYPAIGLAESLGIPGSSELIWPQQLVTEKSPPCLVMHGTHDGMVPVTVSSALRDTYYNNGNEDCYLLIMPLAGHSPDLHFSGFYSQVWVQFLELFLAEVLK